jgi:uncharacterized protein
MNESLPKRKTRCWRSFLRVLLLILIVYLLLILPVVIFQRRLIYFPTRISLRSAEQEAAQRGFQPWRNRSGEIIGWELPANSAPLGSVLVVHGNAGMALNRFYIADPIHQAAALNVYILEYPGYGARAGSPGEKSFLAAADDAFTCLPKSQPIYIVSESLGTGVAAHLAQLHPSEIAGLCLFVPYDKLASVAQSHLPFLPAYFLLRDRFDPADWLKNYRGPAKFVIAGADEVIPPKFGLRLFHEYNGPKVLQEIPHASHNDTAEQSPEWWRAVLKFWRQNAAATDDSQNMK